MENNYNIGDRVMIAYDNDNDGYDKYRNKVMVITEAYYSEEECFAYDNSMDGMGLFGLELLNGDSVDCMLYEYEIENE